MVEEAERLAVSAQDRDPRSILALYRRLLWLRRATPALHGGGQRMLDGGHGVLAWTRDGGGERWLVALNMSSRARRAELARGAGAAAGRLVISTDPDRAEGPVPLSPLALGPDEGVLVRLE